MYLLSKRGHRDKLNKASNAIFLCFKNSSSFQYLSFKSYSLKS